MTGPDFLKAYAILIVAAWVWARWQTRAAREWQVEECEPLAPPLDERELACLRGDINEVLRLTVFALVARGHLRILNKTCLGFDTGLEIGAAEDPPDSDALDPLEAMVHRFFQAPRPPADVFENKDLLARAAVQCRDAERRLNQAGFLTPVAVKRRGTVVTWIAVGLILGVGLLRCVYALSRGNDHVGYLLVMGLIGAGVAVALSQVPRLSVGGRAYLAGKQEEFAELKESIARLDQPLATGALVAAVALFGFGVLKGTAYAKLSDGFPRAASSGGCGGVGCGGGGCGGGGCGGGCGGCG
jgi:uncharacterized protein (TIGR04222 family)